MYEYEKEKNPSNGSGGSYTANSIYTTSASPRIKRVTVTVYEYDKDGHVTKETCTETEYTDGGTWYQQTYPQPYIQPYVTWTSGTASAKLPGVDSSE